MHPHDLGDDRPAAPPATATASAPVSVPASVPASVPVSAPASGAPDAPSDTAAVTRTFDAPGLHGVTFHEVRAGSILERLPGARRAPLERVVNPYLGCSHACGYCFARTTRHRPGRGAAPDFDSQIVVKVNAAELLRRELAGPVPAGGHVALGTRTDCYQQAEAHYRLMPGILAALGERAVPFSVLTKGTLILRDLGLLRRAADAARVGVCVSVGSLDTGLWRALEPGTPPPAERLEACAALTAAGVPCGVLMAPVIPFLGDSPVVLRETVRAAAEAGAVSVTPLVLHLRPGVRERFTAWLSEHHPRLVPRYEALYAGGSYAPTWYQRRITGKVHELADEYGCGPRRREAGRPARGRATVA
ncbi:radical SAM protein [Streptomyces sp. SCUT-3]|uniref:radical SAM protein n=1 Tax=Streptomyces sp. SCUT-3 TaxID=2684469 RepID=UPI000CBAEA67|nr:radical SAM protein [Streptomyces sp. SCUT-3]PLW72229.1 radical SAM protein [Streptomyces sp. DJ]QMV21258.1 radical SAM protein [Streptomyces sp. SCUT-3]